ncbi:MAG: alpha/beta hydrolase [Candidatus Dormibacteria bacterium]
MLRLEVEVNGAPLVAGDYGGEGPPLVMLHGIGGAKINWMLLAPLLTDTYHVLALDLPGFGETALRGRSAGLDAQRDLVIRFIEQLAAGPALLMGHSMGGLISMMAAAARPDLVSRMVLFDPAFPPRTRSPAPGVPTPLLNLMSRAPARFAPVGKALTRIRGARATVLRALRETSAPGSRLPGSFIDAHVDAEARRSRGPQPYVGYLQAWRWFTIAFDDVPRLEAMVREIQAPTLLFHGVEDAVVSPAAARRLAELQPGWRLHLLEDVGHNPNFEAPERSAALVRAWLGEVSSSSG